MNRTWIAYEWNINIFDVYIYIYTYYVYIYIHTHTCMYTHGTLSEVWVLKVWYPLPPAVHRFPTLKFQEFGIRSWSTKMLNYAEDQPILFMRKGVQLGSKTPRFNFPKSIAILRRVYPFSDIFRHTKIQNIVGDISHDMPWYPHQKVIGRHPWPSGPAHVHGRSKRSKQKAWLLRKSQGWSSFAMALPRRSFTNRSHSRDILLVGGLEDLLGIQPSIGNFIIAVTAETFLLVSIILGISSSQLTKIYFRTGCLKAASSPHGWIGLKKMIFITSISQFMDILVNC